jgi:hypothetical protein
LQHSPSPYISGRLHHDQGISKGGNSIVRTRLVQLAWRWVRFQNASGITAWFIQRTGGDKLCKDIDERVNAFLDRPLDGEWPYLWLDATYLKVRDGGRIVSVAAIIATAVDTDRRREIVGLGLGPPRPSRSGRPS